MVYNDNKFLCQPLWLLAANIVFRIGDEIQKQKSLFDLEFIFHIDTVNFFFIYSEVFDALLIWSQYLKGFENIVKLFHYTANISAVKITVFWRVPFPAVIPLYYLHLITALSTVEKCKHQFTVVYYKIYTFTW